MASSSVATVRDGRQSGPPRGSTGRRRAGLAIALAATLALGGCGLATNGFLSPAGPVAASQRWHFWFVIGCMAVVILPLYVALPVILWRYRYGGGRGSYQPRWHYQKVLEYLIWGLPVVIVLVMSVVLWQQTRDLDPYKPIASEAPTLEVQAVALDWKWLFIYPEQGVATVNRLVVPAGRPLRFELTSGTVMQALMIPRLGGQIYAMGGMVTELNLMADETGTFRGQNTQYNGHNFPDQKFDVEAVSAADFEDWVARTKAGGGTLDWNNYTGLTVPSTMQPRSYADVAPHLFDNVVAATRSPVAWVAE